MESYDRYVLGLAVLEGDRDARKILADLLEETGERGLAQWARACKAKANQRLDFTIMLLPCRSAIHFGCGCVKHSLARVEAGVVESICKALEVIELWTEGKEEDDEVLIKCRNAFESAVRLSNLLRDYQYSGLSAYAFETSQSWPFAGYYLLTESIKCALQGDACLAQGEFSMAAHFDQMAHQHIREIARQARREGSWNTQLAWQMERAKEHFTKLLSPQDVPWPK